MDESEKVVIDAKLQMIMEQIKAQPVITITYFVPDEKKTGGAYHSKTGVIRRIDEHERTIQFNDRIGISIEDIIEIRGDIVRNEVF